MSGDNILKDAYIVDAIRTPIGRYGGALSAVRADDLGAIPIKALAERHPDLFRRIGANRPAEVNVCHLGTERCVLGGEGKGHVSMTG